MSASIFLVNVDNVGSNQMHQIRVALRGKGVVLMGKNTMVRRALRSILSEFPEFERLLPYVKGNIGFVFTSGDLKDIRETIVANKVAAPARAGAYAPMDVFVPAGNTGMEPGKTSFFQALNIPTKIARGTIEIVSDIKVVSAGSRVGPSEATLLNMLNISPFTYGMTVEQIFDNGNIFSPAVLDVGEEELIGRFMSGIKTIAAISLAINYPTIVSVSHTLVNAYKNLLAVSIATDYTFEGSEKVSIDLVNVQSKDGFHTLKILNRPWTCVEQHNPFLILPFINLITIVIDIISFRSRTCWRTPTRTLQLPQLPPLRLPLLQRRPRRKRRRKKRRRTLMLTWASVSSTNAYVSLACFSHLCFVVHHAAKIKLFFCFRI